MPIRVVSYVNDVEISIQEFVISRLLVLSIIIHKPNAVQAVIGTVISYPEDSPYLVFPGRRMLVCNREPHDRLGWNWDYFSHGPPEIKLVSVSLVKASLPVSAMMELGGREARALA
jgi:hypothetical protein